MSRTVVCPGCRREVPHVARCPECDYPLVLVPATTQAPVTPHAPARRPGERPGENPTEVVAAPQPTFGPPPTRPPAAPSEPMITCPDPYCGTPNPVSRTLCVSCGAALRQVRQTPTMPPPPPPARRSPLPRILAGVGAVLVVAAIGVWAGTALLRGPDKPAPTPPKPLPATQDAPVVSIPVTDITATATSVQDTAGSITYGAGNLLDGVPATAWNSKGGLSEQRGELSVTFRFSKPYDLRAITVLNGYQKKRGGNKPLDLFVANSRPSKLEVRTDTQKAPWALADTRSPQTLKAPFGRTQTLTLVVLDVVPGKTYADVALSEVSFLGVPAS